MATTLDRLERAYDIMVRIVAGRKDGKDYLPVVLHLEKRIAAQQGTDEDFQRILDLAARKAA